MISEEQIRNLIQLGEGYQAEFKVSVPANVRKLSEEICAFANSAGGTLLIGVDDSNHIKGAKIDNTKRSAIQDSLGEITPRLNCQLEVIQIDGKEIGLIEVQSGRQKPYVLSGAIYVRIGANTQKLTTAEEMRDFFQQADRIYFDEQACKDFDIQKDLDSSSLATFKAIANIPQGIDNQQIFSNLKLFAESSTFKNGAVLFFGKEPEQFFEKAITRCVAFDGTNKVYIVDDKHFGGSLYSQYKQALFWLKNKINVGYKIEGQGGGPRKEIWEIPEDVFKEALINALSHRDYYDKGGTIIVEVFNDRVEITNPGGLVSAISENEFGRKSHSRNPLVFGLFYRMGLVEQIGSGISRMKDLMRQAGLPEPEYNTKGLFTLIVRKPVKWTDKRNDYSQLLTQHQICILDLIDENSDIKIKELSKKIGISKTSIDKNLKILKDKKFLIREGNERSGYWIIKLSV